MYGGSFVLQAAVARLTGQDGRPKRSAGRDLILCKNVDK